MVRQITHFLVSKALLCVHIHFQLDVVVNETF